MMATYVETEATRQQTLADVADTLRARKASVDDAVHNLTAKLAASESKVVTRALASGGQVLGTRLHGFRGTLKGKLGPELAAHARIAGVGGIFHSDELPGYGITDAEVAVIAATLAVGPEDAFVLVADEETKAREALAEVVARAKRAIEGVTAETRDPKPDGTTVYSRPLPGRARMYSRTGMTRSSRRSQESPETPKSPPTR